MTASPSPVKNFHYTAEGVESLAKSKQVFIPSSRSGPYVEGPFAASDHPETYLRAVLGFLGIADTTIARAESVATSDAPKAESLKSAKESIPSLILALSKAA